MTKVLLILISVITFSSCILIKNENREDESNNQTTKTMNVMKPVEWRHNTNIYEVNVRQYTPEGTFNAFLKELPRLKEMGVQTLWFMPITPIAKEKMKGTMGSYYACSDYTSINPEFGTMDDFINLVKTAHDQGFNDIRSDLCEHEFFGARDHQYGFVTEEYPFLISIDCTFGFSVDESEIHLAIAVLCPCKTVYPL